MTPLAVPGRCRQRTRPAIVTRLLAGVSAARSAQDAAGVEVGDAGTDTGCASTTGADSDSR